MRISVTISHLEMLSPNDLRPRPAPHFGLAVARVPIAIPELNRFFYTAVGGAWYWLERLVWTYADWMKYLDRPELQTWIVSDSGVPAGYFELEQQPGDSVEIAYFGLLPQFVERGLGGWALTQAVEKAWAMGARRVWLHTCDLDHPRALANYLARGFRQFKTETKSEELPSTSPGPWPVFRDNDRD
jgi:GNAT superfamily N-acetyltransferase